MIEKKVNMVNYVISTPEHQCKTQLYRINQLKGYVRQSENKLVMAVQETIQKDEEGYSEREAWTGEDPPVRLDNSAFFLPGQEREREELITLIQKYKELFFRCA